MTYLITVPINAATVEQVARAICGNDFQGDADSAEGREFVDLHWEGYLLDAKAVLAALKAFATGGGPHA